MSASVHIPIAVLAAVAAIGNVLGVAFLWKVPHAYKIGTLSQWHAEIAAAPGAALASAASFVIGLAALAAFAMALPWSAHASRAPSSRGLLVTGAALVAIGAALNAAGSLAPAAARLFDPVEPAAPRALLAVAVYADAAFNLLLGTGLVLVNVALWRDGAPAWLAVLGIAAGIASVPVSGQAVSDVLARGILVSGPMWLAWLIAIALRGGRLV